LLAFCALGHPDAFYADLLVAGFPWVAARSFPDHHAFTQAEVQRLAFEAKAAEAQGLVCTEKDAVKLGSLGGPELPLPLWITEQEVKGAELLVQFVLRHLSALSVQGGPPGRAQANGTSDDSKLRDL
jgi:tetraacyldisaccharide 4'-kinase